MTLLDFVYIRLALYYVGRHYITWDGIEGTLTDVIGGSKGFLSKPFLGTTINLKIINNNKIIKHFSF